MREGVRSAAGGVRVRLTVRPSACAICPGAAGRKTLAWTAPGLRASTHMALSTGRTREGGVHGGTEGAVRSAVSHRDLSVYQRCRVRLVDRWPDFLQRRADRLRQQARHGDAAEKVAGEILEDLLVDVLDWGRGNLDYQVGRADVILTRSGAKYLVLEVKRPGALRWQRAAEQQAIIQARGYAEQQHVSRIAVSDGDLFYAVDLESGGVPRCRVFLSSLEAPDDLWWVSMHGIYRRPKDLTLVSDPLTEAPQPVDRGVAELLHHKYGLPARCFAYAGVVSDARTWKLPYRLLDGGVDRKRLPKAVQAMLTTYRGERVGGVPEQALPGVLLTLATAACEVGLMPHQRSDAAPCYRFLAETLEQLGLLDRVPLHTAGDEVRRFRS